MSSSTSSSLAKDTLESLGDLSASTWPEWKVYLPKALAAVAREPAANFYLNGVLPKPAYSLDTIRTALADTDKRAEFEKWVSLADSLKLLIVNYGGQDAKARVQGFETEMGDAKGLWDKLEVWYGNTGTGIEKVAIVSKLWHERWDESESPALWFARLFSLSDRLNVAYKADAALATDKTDPSVIAASHAALNNFLLRDIIISFLPASYAETLTPIWTNKSTLDEVKTAIQNLWATRTLREEMAGEEARRVGRANGLAGKGKSEGGYQGKNRKGGKGPYPPRLAADRYTNYQKWRGGTFVDSQGTTRFKIPEGTCFSCFRDGHRRVECDMKNDRQGTARSRAAELKKNNILVPLEDANALLVADLVDPDRPTLTALVAALNLSTSASSPHLLPPPPSSPPHASLSIIDEDVNAVPRNFRVTDDGHDEDALRSAATPDLFSAHPSSHVSLPSKYILDSGATCHFTTRRDHLHNYTPYSTPRNINGAFGSAGVALGEGTVRFSFPSGPVHIASVMLVPALGVNLISMTRLMMAGVCFENDRTTLRLVDEQRRLIAKLPVGASITIEASRVLPSPITPLPSIARNSSNAKPPSVFISSPSSTDVRVWHSRTGHLSNDRLGKLAAGGGKGVEISGWKAGHSFSDCEACAAGKLIRTPVSASSTAATRRIEQLVADVWGPSPIAGSEGSQYIVGMIDSATRFMWVKGVKRKSEVGGVIQEWVKARERETGEKVVIFQSDQGGEFVGGPLPGFLKAAGITHFRTVPYVHGQNGLIERQWRTLFETVRCWLAESGLPYSFWIHALLAAARVRNISPTISLPNSISPSHAYYKTIPDLSSLRAWGCVAHIYVEGPRRGSKVEPRSVRGRFVGYEEGVKGWKFWVPEWKKMVVAWTVWWFETEYGRERSAEEDELGRVWLRDMLVKADEVDEGRRLAQEGMVKASLHEDDELTSPPPILTKTPQPPPTLPTSPITSPLPQTSPTVPSQPATIPPAPPRNISTTAPSTAPSPAPPRRSRRLDHLAPEIKVPLDGAPPDPELPASPPSDPTPIALSTFSSDSGLSNPFSDSKSSKTPSATHPPARKIAGTRFPYPKPKPDRGKLAYAVLDPDLDSDPDAVEYVTLSLTPEEAAFAVGGEWGNIDHPTIKQAMARPDWEKFRLALEVELAVLDALKTLKGGMKEGLMDLPLGKKAIPLKWELVIKRDGEGRIIKYKARLVARGDRQIDGVDYDETHSSTVRLTTVRLIYALLARHPHWKLLQFDITSAYLHGLLDHEIYIQQPPGFENPLFPRRVLRLQRALYGLKQGGREWQKVFRTELEKLGFKRCDLDHGLYVREREGKLVLVPTHVDDGLMVGDDDLERILDELNEAFEGRVKREDDALFLGMRVKRTEDGGVSIDQGHYAAAVLERFGLDKVDVASTPIDYSAPLPTPASEDERIDAPYRELLGALVWLSSCTRPDLAFAVSVASRYSACPAERHWTMLKRICRYVAGTLSHGLHYSPSSSAEPFSPSHLSGWSDSDHAADKETRRSVSGFVFCIGEFLTFTAICWNARRQRSVAISSTEAEYMTLSEAAREAIWLRQLLTEIGFPPSSPTLIRGDNSGALLLADHPTSHGRTKHIAVHYHFTREHVEEGTVMLKWVPTGETAADLLTKGLAPAKHFLFTKMCGMIDCRRKEGCKKGSVEAEKVAAKSEDSRG
ncbi:hypothetical protein JCM11641_003308 [Rhodosporidiobolus odoratus]